MFVGTGTPRKPDERAEARRLRLDEGMPIKRIAARLGVSPSSVHYWTRGIVLSPEQFERNLKGPTGPQNAEHIAARMAAWSARNRERRAGYQRSGRERARRGDDPVHLAGCMLYWAEGAKSRNSVKLANSDPHMLTFFATFLRRCFDLQPSNFTVRLNVYLNNGMSLHQIEEFWLAQLDLPRDCLRKHALNSMPTSSSGRKRHKLPYGVCTLAVYSTEIVQHIFGAIQEYAGFDEPRWLDGPPRPPIDESPPG
jgi:Homeodomain-like domain